MAVQTDHPTAELLRSFALGSLAPQVAESIEAHIAECDACCQALCQMPDDTFIGRLQNAATQASPAAQVSAQPARRSIAVPDELKDHPRYHVTGVLGAGGMGVVFRAEHKVMGRPVALKTINRELLSDAKTVARFRREMRSAAALVHPNIVTAHDAETAGDLHFLVTELVEGIDLERLVSQRGPLPADRAAEVCRQAALGLAHAASKGMVHRDIKPHNLMLTQSGQIKILDFGLARAVQESRLAEDDTLGGRAQESTMLTRTDMVVGTPDYIAPEQASDSANVDSRADIYALGCTLFFLLSGQPPFRDASVLSKLNAHMKKPAPRLSEHRQDVPPGLQEVVDRMMAKRPEDRFQSPKDVVAALGRFTLKQSPFAISTAAKRAPVSSIPPGRSPRANWPLWLGAAAVLGLIPLAMLMAWPDRSPDMNPEDSGSGTAIPSPDGEPMAPAIANPATVGETAPRVLIVLPPQDVYYPDYGPVRAKLESLGVSVTTASLKAGRVPLIDHPTSAAAPPVLADVALSDVNPLDYGALVFTGYDVSQYIEPGPACELVGSIIERAMNGGGYVTSICSANAVLSRHGVLDKRQGAYNEFLVTFGCDPNAKSWQSGKRLVIDRGVITASSAEDGTAFAEAIARSLGISP
jgi:serine/threonine-protein kinase